MLRSEQLGWDGGLVGIILDHMLEALIIFDGITFEFSFISL